MIGAAVKNRKIIFFFLMVIFIGGIVSYIMLPKQEAPDINPPVVRITAIYPGASQEDVNGFVTEKIEDRLMNLKGYDYSNAYVYNNVTTIICFMKYGEDPEQSFNEVRREMTQLQEELPEEVLTIQVDTDLTETAGIIIALTGEAYDYDALGFYGERIVKSLKEVPGITKFEMDGDVGSEVRITVDHAALNRLDISYSELLQLLQAQNLEIPSGDLDVGGEAVPLQIKGSFSSLEDIENIVISVSQDNYSVLKLKDIATVSYEEEEASTVFLRNGQKTILLTGYFEDNKNVLSVGKDVRAAIEEVKLTLPDDLSFEEVIFQPEEVQNAIDGFAMNLLMGIVLVIIVVFVGMGFRNAIIVSMAIPSSIVATLLMMPFFDIKVHVISITAFIVALGMLVDNAIVVSDAIQNKLDDGMDKLEACVQGTKEVIISILSSTLTTVAAFSPLMMLNSLAGDYVKALPQVVVISLAASFFFAFLVTPSLAFVFFKPGKHRGKSKEKTVMQQLLEKAIQHKFIAFGSGLLIIGLLGSSFLLLNIIFFPKADKTLMYIDVVAEKNIDTAFTKGITDQIEDLLDLEEGVLNYTTAIGGSIPKYYDTLPISAEIPENAQILLEVNLEATGYKKNTDYGQYLQQKIDAVLEGGEATVKELEYAEPIGAPINIRITGEDEAQLFAISDDLELLLNGVPGSTNVRTDYGPYVYEYQVDLEEQSLGHYGLMKYDVLNEVSIALRGRTAGTFRKDGSEYDILLEGDLETSDDVENLMIKSSLSGNKHLLKDLGHISLIKSRPSINKYDGKIAITLMSDLEKGYDSGTVERAFKEAVKEVNLGSVDLIYDGESSKIGTYFGNLGITAAFAVIAIFSILLVQFKNYRQSLIILLSLPLSAAGAIFGLFVMDQPISFTAMLGIISLIGIVVNNAIVLMDYINMERSEGLGVDDAAINASVARFRPIILSTVTTVIGLLPLMFSNSELFKPMSVALVFGLLISTFLTLVFIPLTYSVVFHTTEN